MLRFRWVCLRFYAKAGKTSSDDKVFDKILVANRGEIACRVMRTAKRMGIKTVAVYSDADVDAVFVRMADERHRIGPAESAKSYLNIDAIAKAVRASGAQAVHPGYGFLSENAHFVQALDAIGVRFIGPPVAAMASLGDKIESKRIARKAGVHIVPGFDGVVKDEAHAVKVAQDIGYPVMIKASAGGGGKGMRIAWNDAETRENFRLAASEAKSSFADDRMLIEKYIEHPRHVEVQLIADTHGSVLYLPERECSIQRRNQKVVEEAPCPVLSAETRRAMGEQAAALARSVSYTSAGTVEFMLDKHGQFYFLEMNTRLQVEHPITELITGLDLVELMIRVAGGQPLPLKQSDVAMSGWAVESRVYAEDPKRFLPCTGTLERYREPEGPGVRCDSGVREGSAISIYYDPMICKLSTHGKTRTEALERMRTALDRYVIRGVTHNIPLLRAVVSHADFVSGRDISTAFLDEEFPGGYDGWVLSRRESVQLAAFAAKLRHLDNAKRHQGPPAPIRLHISGHAVDVSGECDIAVDGRPVSVDDFSPSDDVVAVSVSNEACIFQVVSRELLAYRIQFKGTVFSVKVLTEQQKQAEDCLPAEPAASTSSAAEAHAIRSPMPGQIVSVAVAVGDAVEAGDELLVVEAMKMQNVIRAGRAGRVAAVNASRGQSVSAEDVLVTVV